MMHLERSVKLEGKCEDIERSPGDKEDKTDRNKDLVRFPSSCNISFSSLF